MDAGGCPLVQSLPGSQAGSFVECGRYRSAELIRKGHRLFKDVTRDRAKSLTRAGQIGAVALASLAGVVFAVGLPGTAVPKIERAETIEPSRPIDAGFEQEKPAILERRAASIAANLGQLGNRPKPPPPAVEPGDDLVDGGETPVPVAHAPETAIIFLGLLGSPARPMALVSIDSHQQVLAVGDIIHKGSGESIKLVKVEKTGIEVEVKGATKKVEVAPRTGATYTTLQSSPSAPSPPAGIVPGVPPPSPGANPNRLRRDNEMRPPGGRRQGQRFDDSGGVRE